MLIKIKQDNMMNSSLNPGQVVNDQDMLDASNMQSDPNTIPPIQTNPADGAMVNNKVLTQTNTNNNAYQGGTEEKATLPPSVMAAARLMSQI